MYNIFHCEFCGEDYAVNEKYERYFSSTCNIDNWKPHNCETSKDPVRIKEIKFLDKFRKAVKKCN